MNFLRTFAASRTPREQALACAMAALVLVWLGFAQIWQPLQAEHRRLAARIPRLEAALAQLQSVPATAADPAPDQRPTAIILTTSAETFGLRISRLQPQGTQVQLALEDAAFDTVLMWIETLERDHALRLIALNLTRRPATGVVATTLTVER